MYRMCCNIRQNEQHTLGVVGLVHPLYSTQYVYQLLHTHRHNNQYVQYVFQYQAKRAAHSGCGAPMVRNVHTHNNCIIDAYCTAHTQYAYWLHSVYAIHKYTVCIHIWDDAHTKTYILCRFTIISSKLHVIYYATHTQTQSVQSVLHYQTK